MTKGPITVTDDAKMIPEAFTHLTGQEDDAVALLREKMSPEQRAYFDDLIAKGRAGFLEVNPRHALKFLAAAMRWAMRHQLTKSPEGGSLVLPATIHVAVLAQAITTACTEVLYERMPRKNVANLLEIGTNLGYDTARTYWPALVAGAAKVAEAAEESQAIPPEKKH